jgi:hypothetical protein
MKAGSSVDRVSEECALLQNPGEPCGSRLCKKKLYATCSVVRSALGTSDNGCKRKNKYNDVSIDVVVERQCF